MNQEREQVILEALDKYGKNHQLTKTIEELAELTVEVAKCIGGAPNREAIISEMADVTICMEYLKIIGYISDEEIDNEVGRKLNRLNWRMTKENL